MSELKPCPFCGKNYAERAVDEFGDEYFTCEYCGGSSGTIDDACVWNTRPIEDALNKRIAELEAERRWIPVSERLPDNWESVLTIDISKSTRDAVTAFYNPETSRWSTHSAGDLWVTHWMPLPEPPIVYGKVCEE